MRSPRLPCLAAVALAVFYVTVTTPQLPPWVGTHFGTGGAANAWMSRSGYRLFMLGFVGVYPLLMTGLLGYLPRALPGRVNIPNRDYWLAPERRMATLDALAERSWWVGILITGLGAGCHWCILVAHGSAPPRLPAGPFIGLLLVFSVALAAWIWLLWRRFRMPS